MAAAIKKASGVEAKLVGGAGGIFDVKVDGKLVFSKHEVGRFPDETEILEVLAPRRA